eukprot:425581-Rhodomonas_salina.4
MAATLLSPIEIQALMKSIRKRESETRPDNKKAVDTSIFENQKEVGYEPVPPLEAPAMESVYAALDSNLPSGERKRKAKGILSLLRGLVRGPLSAIDLSSEEAVRDFLIDGLLDDIKVSSSFQAVAELCFAKRLHQGTLTFVLQNLQALFTMPMPKRDGNTLVHAACKEENIKVLGMVLDFCTDPAMQLSEEQLEK